jgi:rubrerythrin
MTVEEAIKTAIEYETKVRDVYLEALEKASDENGKRIFKLMADEEQYHLDYLYSTLAKLQASGELTIEGLRTALPSKERIIEGTQKMQAKVSEADYGVEINMLEKALEAEKVTASFYRKMVAELPGEAQGMFTQFVEIEEGHLALVQAELDSVAHNGFWFGMQEFDLYGEG